MLNGAMPKKEEKSAMNLGIIMVLMVALD